MVYKVIVAIYILAGSLYWLYQLYIILRVIKSVPLLENLKFDETENWPKVSIIVPARNEEGTIESAVHTRLQDDYPNFEAILIDDRSTDRTSEIIAKIANKDKRVKAIHIKELPNGWLGKLYAMHCGVAAATGDWFLFSDADIHIKPTTLKRVIAYCEGRKLDHLALFPEMYHENFLLDAVLSNFVRQLCMWCRIWAIEDEKSEAFIGAGAFNLVRRSAFEKTGGFEYLKFEVCDDIALGQMLKKSGAKGSVVNGSKFVGVHFYRALRAMAIGAERAIFTVLANFSAVRMIMLCLISLALEMSPFVALFVGNPYIRILGGVMIIIALAIQTAVNRWANRAVIPGLFIPVASVLMNFIGIRAGILGAIRGGIFWRGTFYPTATLKAGRRLEFSGFSFK